MQTIVDFAEKELKDSGTKTILFIDEIHRFNKAQQDYLLPYVENGTVILIGATTENPYFEVNGALLSRSQIFCVNPLDINDIVSAMKRITEKLNMENNDKIRIVNDDAYSFLAESANGNARTAINALDLAFRTTIPFISVGNSVSTITVTRDIAANCIQKKIKQYDKDGDNHYLTGLIHAL